MRLLGQAGVEGKMMGGRGQRPASKTVPIKTFRRKSVEFLRNLRVTGSLPQQLFVSILCLIGEHTG